MAFETNKEPRLDVMQPDLDDIDPDDQEEKDSAELIALLLKKIEALEVFLVDFGWE